MATFSREPGSVFKPYLIDGTYELFRSYFGAPQATGAGGREVGAVRGLVRSLMHLLRTESVGHAGIAFDTVIESFRNQLFPGYKTGDGLPADLVAQFPLAEEAAAALGLVVWPMIEFEADDAIASAAALAAADPRVEQVIIASPDKDFAQCVTGARVVCLDRLRSRTMDEDGVVQRFGIGPASIPDYLALVGDDADGIPGLAGWGARSTAAVLAHYRHIESIPDDASAWGVTVRGARSLAATLAAGRDDALLYRRLATLRTDAPLGIGSVDGLAWLGADRARFARLAAELAEPGLVEAVPRWRE